MMLGTQNWKFSPAWCCQKTCRCVITESLLTMFPCLIFGNRMAENGTMKYGEKHNLHTILACILTSYITAGHPNWIANDSIYWSGLGFTIYLPAFTSIILSCCMLTQIGLHICGKPKITDCESNEVYNACFAAVVHQSDIYESYVKLNPITSPPYYEPNVLCNSTQSVLWVSNQGLLGVDPYCPWSNWRHPFGSSYWP